MFMSILHRVKEGLHRCIEGERVGDDGGEVVGVHRRGPSSSPRSSPTPPLSSPTSPSPSPLYLQWSTLPQPVVPFTWTWCFMLDIIIQWCVAILWCLSRFLLSYRWLMNCYDWFELHVLLLCCPIVPSVSRKRRDPRCRVCNMFMICLLWVAWVTEAQTRVSRLFAYGIKGTWYFNAMVGFYLNDL